MMDVMLDKAQQQAKSHFDGLALKLRERNAAENSWFKAVPKVKSLYLWGPVGRGKTMLMDAFFEEIGDPRKQRLHFHAFMQQVRRLRSEQHSADVIADIALGFSTRIKLLCLDEMQVSDIADAMILGRLFEALTSNGVVIVTTSNQPPEGLYKDGLNRQLFLPVIDQLNAEFEVVQLQGGVDYRLGRLAALNTFVFPLSAETDQTMTMMWEMATDGKQAGSLELDVLGRKLKIPQTARRAARFDFRDLCDNPLGPADYLAIAKSFSTVFIDHIPSLKASDRNATKRFILLIDTLYDTGTKLVASAADEPEQLLEGGAMQDEFLRTASRLREMQSQSWWGKA